MIWVNGVYTGDEFGPVSLQRVLEYKTIEYRKGKNQKYLTVAS